VAKLIWETNFRRNVLHTPQIQDKKVTRRRVLEVCLVAFCCVYWCL